MGKTRGEFRYESLLESVTYSTTDLTNSTRTIEWAVTDQSGAVSATQTSTINVGTSLVVDVDVVGVGVDVDVDVDVAGVAGVGGVGGGTIVDLTGSDPAFM